MDCGWSEGGTGDYEEVVEVCERVQEDGGRDEGAGDVEEAEMREECDGEVDWEIGVLCLSQRQPLVKRQWEGG